MKTFYWLIKREFWENRGSFLWAPLITACVFIVFQSAGLIQAQFAHHAISSNSIDAIVNQVNNGQGKLVGLALDMSIYSVTWMVYLVSGITLFFYCLGSLYDDRNDRSFLFWKSLPISDRDTVLSKLASATVLAPAIATVVGIVAGIILLVLTIIGASLFGIHAWPLLGHAHPFRVMGMLLATIPVNVVWALPGVGWLMLCSAWARGKPFLWATTIPLGAGAMIYWLDVLGVLNFGSWFWHNIVVRAFISIIPWSWFPKSFEGTPFKGLHAASQIPGAVNEILNLGHIWGQLLKPEFWGGGLIGIAMIAAAIWLRRWRTET